MVMMATSAADATRSLGESVEDENKRRGQRSIEGERERGRDETGIASTATVVAGVIDRRRRRRRRRRHSAHHSPPRFPIDSVSVSGLDGWMGWKRVITAHPRTEINAESTASSAAFPRRTDNFGRHQNELN